MKKEIDVDTILAPVSEDNPAGEDLRYTPVYDDIKEAKREDDLHDTTIPERNLKRADWNRTIDLCVDALTGKTKDIQIAAWLTEALIKTEGFEGLLTGLKITVFFLNEYWESLYPRIEDGDLDFRVGPIEFMNDKLSFSIKQVPLTDNQSTPGYTLYQWDEAHQVGYEADTRNKYGDVDESKKQTREELISEGKLSPEDFDIAVEQTSKEYYKRLSEIISVCNEEFLALDKILDEKFGPNAPRTAEIREAIEFNERVVTTLLGRKLEGDPDPEPLPKAEEIEVDQKMAPGGDMEEEKTYPRTAAGGTLPLMQFSNVESVESVEDTMWEDALKKLKSGGIKSALDQLYKASCSMPSTREQNRYRLLMAKLCLKAERPDLARPIVEQLFALIEEFQLGRWESPMWIAEVFETLYQCLTAGDPDDEDMGRAQELFRRICTMDVTKAMMYRT